jgi:hypothetical protein
MEKSSHGYGSCVGKLRQRSMSESVNTPVARLPTALQCSHHVWIRLGFLVISTVKPAI